MRGPHDYNAECQCYRCKGIRNDPRRPKTNSGRVGNTRWRRVRPVSATREEQHGRYLDAGPGAWDDRD